MAQIRYGSRTSVGTDPKEADGVEGASVRVFSLGLVRALVLLA